MSEEQKNDEVVVTPEAAAEPATAAAPESEPASSGGQATVELDLVALNKQIEGLAKELEDWRGRAYRGAADLDNFRKRALKDREELRKYAIEGVLKDLIPVADNLERALSHAGTGGGALAEGVAMISKQFLSGLERSGAKPFDPKGQQFDPQFHEAMSQMPRDGAEAGEVIEVFQRGWMLHDRLVRPAMVVIATGDPAATSSAAVSGDTVETSAVSGGDSTEAGDAGDAEH